jgi:hypothetical protein
MLMFTSRAHSQGQTLWGSDFYTTFPANDLADYQPDATRMFELFISTSIQTQVTITQASSKFTLDTVLGTNTTTAILLPAGVECQSDEIVERGYAVHITATADVQVVALSHKALTSDAWAVYPTKSLGTTYRPLCFTASVNPLIFGNTNSRPSEFAVIATANNTQITINPKSMTAGGTPVAFNAVLNAGDVMQVMSSVVDSTMDLTGSLITSDKPIAVLSGHRRTECPSSYVVYNNNGIPSTSRDFLCEQMPPVSAWAKQAIVVPQAATGPQTLVRILSASDHNAITIDGVSAGEIQAGEFLQIDSIGQSIISATAPILVGEYMHTANGVNALGDPSLSIADAPPLVGGTHHLISISNPADYTSTFATVVAKDSDFGSIQMNGISIPPKIVNRIGSTGYSFARLTLTASDNIVSSSVPYSASICGEGSVISYAYTFPTALFANAKLAVDPTENTSTFSVDRIAPNPLTAGNALSIGYRAPEGSEIRWSLIDAAGRTVADGVSQAHGADQIAIGLAPTVSNGVYLLRLTALDQSGSVLYSSSEKIAVIR